MSNDYEVLYPEEVRWNFMQRILRKFLLERGLLPDKVDQFWQPEGNDGDKTPDHSAVEGSSVVFLDLIL